MALLSAAELLSDKETQHVIQIDGIRAKKTDEPASISITVKNSRDIVKIIKRIRDKATSSKSYYHTKGKKKSRIELDTTVDHDLFCRKTLEAVYVEADGDLIDEYSIDIIMAATELYPNFLETLSGALLDFFQSGGKIEQQEEEDDKKK